MLFVNCSTHHQFSELTLFLTDMTQSTQSRKRRDSDDKMCQVMRCKFTVLQFQCQNCRISSRQVTLIKPNWPNFYVNTGVVNMLPVFHLLSGGFADLEKAVIMRDREEADTRLILHASDAKQISERIVIWSPYTDIGF